MKKTITPLLLFLSATCMLSAQSRMVTGTVNSERGAPLTGASVFIKNSPPGTTTATDGTCQIEVPEGFNTLVISYLGYEAREININGTTPTTLNRWKSLRMLPLRQSMAPGVPMGSY